MKAARLTVYCPRRPQGAMPLHEQVRYEFSRAFGGCTLLLGEGEWVDPRNEHVVEPVAVVQVMLEPEIVPSAVALAQAILAKADEQVMCYTVEETDVEFVQLQADEPPAGKSDSPELP